MTILLTIGLLTMFASPPDNHPARVAIEQARTETHNGVTTGSGAGNVITSDGTQGFDYVFQGCTPFQASRGGSLYPATWDGKHSLTIRMKEVGSDRTHDCELKVSLRNFVYVMKDGQLKTAKLKWRLRRDHATND
jgi:hypothetical protein